MTRERGERARDKARAREDINYELLETSSPVRVSRAALGAPMRRASGKSRLARRKYFIGLDDKRKQFMRFRERQPGIRSRYEKKHKS